MYLSNTSWFGFLYSLLTYLWSHMNLMREYNWKTVNFSFIYSLVVAKND